jgi:hypothetical protein
MGDDKRSMMFRHRHRGNTSFSDRHSTVIDFVCDDSFKNHHQETVMYQQNSCSAR